MKRSISSRGLFSPGLIAISLILGAGLVFVTILSLDANRPPRTPVGVVTAALTVIPAPTSTSPPATPPPTEPASASDLPPALSPGELAVGAFAQISGTGGDGLRLRADPGLAYESRFLGLEAEVFQIEAGPQDVDGYTWWLLVDPVDTTRRGWAVSSYLEAIQEP